MKPSLQNQCCPPQSSDSDPIFRSLEGEEANKELSTLAKALGHPARIKILRLLIREENCICGEVVEEVDLAQSTVSQHLKILKEAGLIRGEIEGTRTCYCLDSNGLKKLKVLIASL